MLTGDLGVVEAVVGVAMGSNVDLVDLMTAREENKVGGKARVFGCGCRCGCESVCVGGCGSVFVWLVCNYHKQIVRVFVLVESAAAMCLVCRFLFC